MIEDDLSNCNQYNIKILSDFMKHALTFDLCTASIITKDEANLKNLSKMLFVMKMKNSMKTEVNVAFVLNRLKLRQFVTTILTIIAL